MYALRHFCISILVIFCLLNCKSVNAQKENTSFGLFAEYLFHVTPRIEGTVAEKYYVFNGGGEGTDGYRIGAFAKYKDKNGYWTTELSYSFYRSNVWIENLNWQEEWAQNVPSSFIAVTAGFLHKMFSMSIHRAHRLKNNFYLEGGLSASLFKENERFAGYPDIFFDTVVYNKPTKIIYRMADSLKSFVLFGNLRLSYEFGPLNVYTDYSYSLSPFINKVKYEGSTSTLDNPFRINIFSLGVSYTLLALKE